MASIKELRAKIEGLIATADLDKELVIKELASTQLLLSNCIKENHELAQLAAEYKAMVAQGAMINRRLEVEVADLRALLKPKIFF